VNGETTRYSLLDRLYVRFLDDENSAAFIAGVSLHYTVATLERLAQCGSHLTRRGAVLALGFVAGMEANAVLGGALHDADHGVRVLAENAIREVWMRDGTEAQRQELGIVIRLNNCQRFSEAVERATALIETAPRFSEAWNQRAIAWFQLRDFEEAANDCHQALELNAYHFGAAVGLAHCYLELGEGLAALEGFRRVVRINPSLEAVRGQIEFLQRALE
jgi:tetratricopeptide (TPR) repeat protein